MAPVPEQDIRSPVASPQDVPTPRRITVFELFQHYVRILSALPGERSEFSQTEMGYEWQCQFDIGPGTLQLHFHLIDLEALPAPAAALFLVEPGAAPGEPTRRAFPLEDLEHTHELLNRCLAEREASVEAFRQADLFLTELGLVKLSLPGEISWS